MHGEENSRMEALIELYKQRFGSVPVSITEIPRAVSARRYFRIAGTEGTLIGTYSPDPKETNAFLYFTDHFRALGIHVPEIIARSDDGLYYLQDDLGDNRLHELVTGRKSSSLSQELINFYRSALGQIVRMQVEGHAGIDYSVCVPRPAFDQRSIMWDLNHFKYYMLKVSGLPFDENALEEGFLQLAGYVGSLPANYFMFRDFQTRNIMIKDREIYLIDYQGGRQGPLQYDVASLIFEGKANLTASDRSILLESYLDILGDHIQFSRDEFMAAFPAVSLVRMLQALGAYGLRGIVEKKAVFLQSIPMGLHIMGELVEESSNEALSSYMRKLLTQLAETAEKYPVSPEPFPGLTLSINSFSYRKPLPDDLTGNGGGFVYDCRFLNNPYHVDELREHTGLDRKLETFFKADEKVEPFISTIKSQLEQAISQYKEKGYKNLMVSFGCTGGRHRSVFTARRIAEWGRQFADVRVIENHRELRKTF